MDAQCAPGIWRGPTGAESEWNQHHVAGHVVEDGPGPRPRHVTGQPFPAPVTQDQQVVPVGISQQTLRCLTGRPDQTPRHRPLSAASFSTTEFDGVRPALSTHSGIDRVTASRTAARRTVGISGVECTATTTSGWRGDGGDAGGRVDRLVTAH